MADCPAPSFSREVPWLWILEHIIDIKDVGTPVLKEIMTYIPDVKKKSRLQKKVALRYLEEVIAMGEIDAKAIPLVVALMKDSLRKEAERKSTVLANRDLLLRVQTEAVLKYLRGKSRDWQGFSQALECIFPEESEDARLIERRKELLLLLQIQDQERNCLKVLETYSIGALQRDLLKCIGSEKARSGSNFLEQLLKDVVEGRYPLSKGAVVNQFFKEDSKTDFYVHGVQRISVGSDDPTVSCDHTLRDDGEDAVDSEHVQHAPTKEAKDDACDATHNTRNRGPVDESVQVDSAMKNSRQADDLGVDSLKERKSRRSSYRPEIGSPMKLRQRNQDGMAVTSLSPLKMDKNDGHGRIEKSATHADNSLTQEFLDLGSDGHEELCHKCGNPGTLVCCDGCPVAVHGACLGAELSTLADRDWFCPVCVQKRAAEAVIRAQEEEREARQRLADFMAGAGRNRKAHQRLSRSSTFPHKKTETDHGKMNAVDSIMRVVETVSKKPSCPESHLPESKQETKLMPLQPTECLRTGSGVACMEATIDAPTGATCSKVNNPAHVNPIEIQEEDGDGHDGDLEEGSEGSKIDDDFSNGRKKSRMQKESSHDISERARKGHVLRGKRNASAGTRRKRLRWTNFEEDVLKEGVKRYSHDNGAWGFQWTRILEFGRGKFHPNRTDMDLKDKWRNLVKASISPCD